MVCERRLRRAAAEYGPALEVTVIQPSPVERGHALQNTPRDPPRSGEMIDAPMREIDHRPVELDDRCGSLHGVPMRRNVHSSAVIIEYRTASANASRDLGPPALHEREC
jgi:hypothetical protein